MKRMLPLILSSAFILSALAGCAPSNTQGDVGTSDDVSTVTISAEQFEQAYGNESVIMELSAVQLPMSAAPFSTATMPVASGTTVYQANGAVIDASNLTDGYVMVKYTAGQAKLKVLVTGPSKVQYTYDLTSSGEFEVFPLSDGSGAYKIDVYKNVSGTKYSPLLSQNVTTTLTDEFAPFLLPNQYVNYSADSNAVALATELTSPHAETLAKVEAVYSHVINNMTYDTELAQTVQSGYLPDVDAVLAKGKGICFDYAAVMASMLRSQEIPTKLVVGYAGQAYHAWISVYSEDTGWVEGAIYFDGTTWKLMDPTFASSGGSSEAIMQYIGDGNNYTEKYLY